MKIVKISATDIPDSWFQCVSSILENGFRYEVQHGSYVGQTRLEFDFVVVRIKYPYREPYDLMLPQIPQHLGIPNPVESGYVEQYMPYLLTEHIEETEQYTYGSRIYRQIPYWIEKLKKTPNTNQAILQVAQPDDFNLEDPPCLRHVDMRIKDGKLIFYPSFRSNDLWGGYPANLAGLAVVQNYMASEIGVETGEMIYSSKGLHLYGYVEELAKLRAGKNISQSCYM